MNRLITLSAIGLALAAGSLLSALSARADDVDLHRLLHGPQRCDHVIGLLHRHGVNNDFPTPAGVGGIHPLGQFAIPAAELGDLQIVSLARRPQVASGCGPAFDLVIKNCSTRDVCGARMTLVALFGRIHPLSPNVTAAVDSIPAGQAVQVTLTLPIESLAMGNLNGQVIGFNRVLVVIDSFDQFLESNEANNLRLWESAAIPVAAVAEVSETTEVAGAVTATGQAVAGQVMTTPTAPVAGDAGQPATPVSGGTQVTPGQPAPSQPSPGQAAPVSNGGISEKELQSAINQFTDEKTEPSSEDSTATPAAS